jgi:hypothetical protein
MIFMFLKKLHKRSVVVMILTFLLAYCTRAVAQSYVTVADGRGIENKNERI